MKMGNFKPKPKPSTQEVKSGVREAVAGNAEDDKLVTQKVPPEPVYSDEIEGDTADRITGNAKLSKLIDDDFPFDESQLEAVDGMAESQYACLTGAAGTGKTTTVKKLVDRLMTTTRIGSVDMRHYWAKDTDDRTAAYSDGDDDYEYNDSNAVIPTIAMCAFTGRASQMIKKNFPRDWHGNIMTIHRMLGFVPESYEEWDDDWEDPETGTLGGYRNKIRFVPTYTEAVKLPWDIILIDEAGMLGLDLWHMLLAACKPGCRIYMIGDINQLQPVHGKSIFGFAMTRWPAYELNKVHRQQGENNPIVDNAWRVIHGQRPVPEGKFQMIELPGDAMLASRKARAIIRKLRDMEIYDPIRDTVITPINGDKGGSGYALGQMPLNREFALMFNPESEHPRYLIDGGRDKKQFAVGDKVMATRNDWDVGITNGMTGIITEIKENEGYAGDRDRFGLLKDVNARFAGEEGELTDGFIDLDSLENSMIAVDDGRKAKKEKRERGPASHKVTVQFGHGEHAFEIPFETLAEVGSLQTAYVTTCHKMQGGEAPVIIVILHESHRRMHYREWLYTAITRASEKCIILYTDHALRVSLNKQSIKGKNLREKVQSFNELMDPRGTVQSMAQLPVSDSNALTILDREAVDETDTSKRLMSDAEKTGGVAQLLAKKRKQVEPESKDEVKQEIHVHVSKVEIKNIFKQKAAEPKPVDGGELRSTQDASGVGQTAGVLEHDDRVGVGSNDSSPALPPPARLVAQHGAAMMYARLRDRNDIRLLTHQPAPKPAEPPKKTLASLFNKKKES